MKNFLKFLTLLTITSIYISCSKEAQNPLKNTLWSDEDTTILTNQEFTRYIEFIDETTVKVWDTYNGYTYTGTYTTNGNNVTFHNLHDSYWGWDYIEGTFSSKSLTITYSTTSTHNSYNTYTKE